MFATKKSVILLSISSGTMAQRIHILMPLWGVDIKGLYDYFVGGTLGA